MKIRTRLFLCYFFIVAAGFYYLVDWILDDLRPRYLESVEESLVDTANILSSIFTQTMGDGSDPAESFRSVFEDVKKRQISARIYEFEKTIVDLRVYVTDSDGIVVFDSEDGRDEGSDYSNWNDVYLTLAGKYGARATRTDPEDPSTAILHVAAPLRSGGKTVGVLTVCKPLLSGNLLIRSAQQKIIIAGIAAGLSVLLLGLVTSTWITRPIEKLTQYAMAVRDGKRTGLPDLGKSEIGVMGKALDEMREALEGKEYVEQYIQTLTHGLKGPLSAIRGAVELLQEDLEPERRSRFLKNVDVETERIQRIADRLLLLASLETRKGLRDVEDLDLVHLVGEVIESFEAHAPSKEIKLLSSTGENHIVRGERFLLYHALNNLIQNAVEFTSENGAIEMMVTESDMIEMTVQDDGSGIPEYALDRVFERFYSLQRPDTGRKSSGLGLGFVREVAELHGGMVSVENRPEGGVKASFRLPKCSNS